MPMSALLAKPNFTNDESAMLAHLVSTIKVYLHAIEVLKLQLPKSSTMVEEATADLSRQFSLLAAGAAEQSQHMAKIVSLADSLQLGEDRISLTEFTQLFSDTLSNSIEKILYVSKRAVTMVYMLDEAIASLSSIEGFVKDIQTINKKTNLHSLNATIEAVRAGEAGKGFQVVAAEVKDVSEQVKNLAQNMRKQITTVSQSVTAGYEVLKDVATTDMSQNMVAQEKLGLLLDSMVKQNTEFAHILSGSAEATNRISSTISSMVMNMQFQDRSAQFIQNSVNLLTHMEHTVRQILQECEPLLSKEASREDAALADEVAAQFRLSEFAQIFRNSIAGLPADTPLPALNAAVETNDIELF